MVLDALIDRIVAFWNITLILQSHLLEVSGFSHLNKSIGADGSLQTVIIGVT